MNKEETKMKFCTKQQDLLKAYHKATNELLEELLQREGYEYVSYYKYVNGKPIDCESDEGVEFVASNGYKESEVMEGYWVGKDIGGVLVISEDSFIDTKLLKEAVELGTATIEDILGWHDYEYDLHERGEELKINFKNWYKLNK